MMDELEDMIDRMAEILACGPPPPPYTARDLVRDIQTLARRLRELEKELGYRH